MLPSTEDEGEHWSRDHPPRGHPSVQPLLRSVSQQLPEGPLQHVLRNEGWQQRKCGWKCCQEIQVEVEESRAVEGEVERPSPASIDGEVSTKHIRPDDATRCREEDIQSSDPDHMSSTCSSATAPSWSQRRRDSCSCCSRICNARLAKSAALGPNLHHHVSYLSGSSSSSMTTTDRASESSSTCSPHRSYSSSLSSEGGVSDSFGPLRQFSVRRVVAQRRATTTPSNSTNKSETLQERAPKLKASNKDPAPPSLVKEPSPPPPPMPMQPCMATAGLVFAARSQLEVWTHKVAVETERRTGEQQSGQFSQSLISFLGEKRYRRVSEITWHARSVPPSEQCFFLLLCLVTFIYSIGILTALVLLSFHMWIFS